ncbi:MAG: ATP-binding protein [Gallionellaceae bacterium]|jgi:PAS domain S-box-containing protein
MKQKARILIVDDDPNLRKTLADILKIKGYETAVAGTGAEAIAATGESAFSLALIDLMLPDMPGLDVMARIKAISPLTEAIILTGHASLDSAIEATRNGAFSYILKPYQMDDLLLNILHGIERHDNREEIVRLASHPRLNPNPVIELSLGGEVTYLNPAAEKQFPDLFALGLEHPLLKGQKFAFDISAQDDKRKNVRETVRETVLGEITYELHTYYVAEISLIRIHVLDISTRKRLEAERQRLSEAVEQALEAIVLTDAEQRMIYVNPAYTHLFGYSAQEVIGQSVDLLAVADSSYPMPPQVTGIAHEQGSFSGEVQRRSKDGRTILVLLNVATIRDEHNEITGYVGTMSDLTEHKRIELEARQRMVELTHANAELLELNAKLEQAQSQLMQSEKMASIGVLAAGVAHEINNPIGYVNSNLGTLEKYLANIFVVLNKYEATEALIAAGNPLLEELCQIKAKVDLNYIREDSKSLIAESHQGLERVKKIVLDLKDFSHSESEDKWREEDIHHGLDSTLNVIWNELKYKCEVTKEYGVLPPVECLLSQLNQVFMNLLVNAAQAIETRGTITIRTGTRKDQVWIEIADTGKGIPPENLSRVFDPFFTTKPVGQGTGLGLSVSFSIIQKHHGEIEVESTPGKGTVFRVILPVKQPASADADI